MAADCAINKIKSGEEKTMQRTPGGGGRKKRVTSGGGNVFKRGEGINSGSRPGGSSGGTSRGNGTRGGGSSLGIIALIAALLLGKNNNGGSNNNRGGCLKRIILLIILLAIASMVVKCMAGGMSGMSGMVEDYTSQQQTYEDNSGLTVVETQPVTTLSPQLRQLRRPPRILQYPIRPVTSAPRS